MPVELREQIKYHVDKGVSREMLFVDMVERDACCSSCSDPHVMAEVEAEFLAMIADGTLTMGEAHGEEDHVVVTAWNPRTVMTIKGQPAPELWGRPREDEFRPPIEDTLADYEEQHSPSELAKHLIEIGMLPEDATEAWFTEHEVNYGDSDAVHVEDVVLPPVSVGVLGHSWKKT